MEPAGAATASPLHGVHVVAERAAHVALAKRLECQKCPILLLGIHNHLRLHYAVTRKAAVCVGSRAFFARIQKCHESLVQWEIQIKSVLSRDRADV